MPVGGGGVLAGIAAYASEHMPHTTVIGAEPAGAASMIAALKAGRPVTLENIDRFADGTAVKRAGNLTYEIDPWQKRSGFPFRRTSWRPAGRRQDRSGKVS